MMKIWIILIFIPLLLQAVTLPEAMELCKRSPRAKIAKNEIAIAKSDLRIASRRLPDNPNLSPYYSSNKNSKDTYGFSIDQRIEIAGQKDYRVSAGRAYVESKKAAYELVLRKLEFKIKSIFLNTWFIRQKILILDKMVRIQKKMKNYLQKRVNIGEISRDRLTFVLMKYFDFKSEKIALQTLLDSDADRLSVLLGRRIKMIDSDFSIGYNLAQKEKLRQKLISFPQVVMARKIIQKNAIEAQKIRKMKYLDDIDFNVFAQRDAGDQKIGAGFSIPLPIFNQRKEETIIAMRKTDQAAISKEQLVKSLYFRFERLYAQALAKKKIIQMYDKQVAPFVKEFMKRTTLRFKKGDISFVAYESGFDRYHVTLLNILKNRYSFLKIQNEIFFLTGESNE